MYVAEVVMCGELTIADVNFNQLRSNGGCARQSVMFTALFGPCGQQILCSNNGG